MIKYVIKFQFRIFFLSLMSAFWVVYSINSKFNSSSRLPLQPPGLLPIFLLFQITFAFRGKGTFPQVVGREPCSHKAISAT